MKYTKKEKKQIAEALKSALPRLWDGRDGQDWEHDEFICLAMNRDLPGKVLAQAMIEKRVEGKDGTIQTVECWLREHGYIEENAVKNQAFYMKLQAYRKAWLEELIREFSK